MIGFKSFLTTSALAVVIAAGALAVTATDASARTACNRHGDCWQTSQRYTTYPTILGVRFYSDRWQRRHHNDRRYHWRDNQKDDRGYYDRGNWHTFDENHDGDHR